MTQPNKLIRNQCVHVEYNVQASRQHYPPSIIIVSHAPPTSSVNVAFN